MFFFHGSLSKMTFPLNITKTYKQTGMKTDGLMNREPDRKRHRREDRRTNIQAKRKNGECNF